MATGNYGIVRPADVDNQDIQIFYNYTSSRQEVGGSMTELDSESLISDVNGGINSTISGIKNLNLPADIFGSTGIYNILVRPRENNISIIDCGVLSVSPDVKGILFNVSDLPSSSGLSLINALRPVTFNWDRREWYDDNTPDGSKIELDYDNKIANSGLRQGFIAQEVQAAVAGEKALVDSQIVSTENPDKLEFAPAHLITNLVKAIQELKAENDALKTRVTTLEG